MATALKSQRRGSPTGIKFNNSLRQSGAKQKVKWQQRQTTAWDSQARQRKTKSSAASSTEWRSKSRQQRRGSGISSSRHSRQSMSVSALSKSGARSAAFGIWMFRAETLTEGRKLPWPVSRFTRKGKIKPVERTKILRVINYTSKQRKARRTAKKRQIRGFLVSNTEVEMRLWPKNPDFCPLMK